MSHKYALCYVKLHYIVSGCIISCQVALPHVKLNYVVSSRIMLHQVEIRCVKSHYIAWSQIMSREVELCHINSNYVVPSCIMSRQIALWCVKLQYVISSCNTSHQVAWRHDKLHIYPHKIIWKIKMVSPRYFSSSFKEIVMNLVTYNLKCHEYNRLYRYIYRGQHSQLRCTLALLCSMFKVFIFMLVKTRK